MDLEPLPSIILAMTERRSLDAVLEQIIGAVARQPGVALARLWLRESDDSCPVCASGRSAGDVALHLRASAGKPSRAEDDWSRISGAFHRVALASHGLKVSRIAATGQAIRIPDLVGDHEWVRDPTWVERERLASFAGQPLVFRGEVLGVLGVFWRTNASDGALAWLRTMADAAAVAIANARAFEENEALRHQLEQERDYLREEVDLATGVRDGILGRSAALQRVLHQVEMVAPTDANVLITGESGTGKELFARAIHAASPRASRALVKVNCASIPRELFESEFFGHVRGAFTGAVKDRIGRFQLADRGTLFLDEVGEIPLELQSKLLRVLQEGEFERVGDDAPRRVNVRVIAATNRNLEEEIRDGRFRLDLYYRLAVFPIEVPPLRNRPEDIPDLIGHFVLDASRRFRLPERPQVPQREVERAQAYSWPGNIRELQNAVERAVIVSGGRKLAMALPAAAAPEPGSAADNGRPADEVITEEEWRRMERVNLEAALRRSSYRVAGKGGAAEMLGLSPTTLTSRMKALGIRRDNGGG